MSTAFTSVSSNEASHLLPESNDVVSSSSGGVSGYQWVLTSPTTADVQAVPPSSDGRIYKCEQCGRQFRQKTTLQQHERTHSDSRPYKCPECGKCFRQQSHLKQHVRIHSQEKPYACDFCKRTFRQQAILNQHLRVHSGEKPYKCTECGKFFRQKTILDQHVRMHMGEKCPRQSKKKSVSASTDEATPSSSGLKPPVVEVIIDSVEILID